MFLLFARLSFIIYHLKSSLTWLSTYRIELAEKRVQVNIYFTRPVSRRRCWQVEKRIYLQENLDKIFGCQFVLDIDIGVASYWYVDDFVEKIL